MNLWQRLRELSWQQLWHFAALFLRNPKYILPTLSATQRTFTLCNELYGTAHHKSNRANAFRHALWNLLICKYVQKRTKNEAKSTTWAKKVTDLYEKVTQNEKMDEAMDLHNNDLGRRWFPLSIDKNEAEIVTFLQKKTENAQKINSLDEIMQHSKNLVYLTS
jgi:hypothetical protein